jgi:drug/metabolite transporter (DMT)-like permease
MIGGPSVLASVMTIGLLFSIPMIALSDRPDDVSGTTFGMLVAAGATNICGLLLIYAALQVGKVSIIAPISSTEGAIAAVLAIVAGEQIGIGSGLMLAVVAIGIALASISDGESQGAAARRGPLLAFGAAACFGVGLFVTGKLSDDLPLAWATLPARVIGVFAIAIPLFLSGRLRMTRQALPFGVVGGILEVVGFLSYAVGSRDAIAIAAVLASQFAAMAAIAAYFLFGERISRVQLAGVVVIAVGVAILSALQA